MEFSESYFYSSITDVMEPIVSEIHYLSYVLSAQWESLSAQCIPVPFPFF